MPDCWCPQQKGTVGPVSVVTGGVLGMITEGLTSSVGSYEVLYVNHVDAKEDILERLTLPL
jgi:hypothetical protein